MFVTFTFIITLRIKCLWLSDKANNFKLLNLRRIETYPIDIYLLKVNNRKTRTRCEICSKSTIKTPERSHWHCSGVFIINFEHIS